MTSLAALRTLIDKAEQEAHATAQATLAALHDVRSAQQGLGFDTSETDAIIERLRTQPITWRELVETDKGTKCSDPECLDGWTTRVDESYSSLDRVGRGSLRLVRCAHH